MSLTVRAHVHREGRFYVIDVEGFGVTQADNPRAVVATAQDYVASLADIDPAEVQVVLAVSASASTQREEKPPDARVRALRERPDLAECIEARQQDLRRMREAPGE